MAGEGLRGEATYAGRLTVLIAAYVTTARLGLSLSPAHGFASLVWPPAGIALFAVARWGYGVWPGIVAGAFLANLWGGAPPHVAAAIGAGNTVEALLGAFVLRHVSGPRLALDRFVEIAALVGPAVATTFVAATVGAAGLVLGGLAPASATAWIWSVWWAGDFMSVLVVAPVLLTWTSDARPLARREALAEVAVLGASLIAGSVLVFAREGGGLGPIFRPTLLFVPVIWAAFRFGTRGSATAAGVIAAVATWGTYTGRGPFARATPVHALLALHAFLVSVSLSALALGAVVCELRASQKELLQALAAEHAAARAKDEFLAVLSHELRTPLQAILGWTRHLQPRLHDENLVARGLGTIERSAAAQTRLIEDLLDVSRIIAGKLRIEREPVDVAAIVAAATDATRSAAEAKSLRVELRLGRLDGAVRGDPARLQQIVVNLLTNAIKFTPSGGWIDVRLERAGAAARIVVADTGCGISPDLLPHVFERFRQGDAGTTRAESGLGLGLAIVRHLVDLHDGKVTAESDGAGRGATFTVTLPLAAAARAAPTPAIEAGSPGIPAAFAGVRVLVVDDDADARELLDIALQEAGAEVRAVPSARAAVAALASFRPDLLLSDIAMPDEDGYALIREVRSLESRQRGSHLPAIAVTAFAGDADRKKAIACGFDAHVAKPVDTDDLATLAAALLGRAPAGEDRPARLEQ